MRFVLQAARSNDESGFCDVHEEKARSRPILVILGPTGTGKTEIAYRSALRFRGEVISFDSIQVYRDLDVGTAKPSRDHRREIRHHCLDIVDPGEMFSLGEFVRTAEDAIQGIRSRNHLPVLAGGTGLYLQGILHGILRLPSRDGALRERLKRSSERHGPMFLHRLLRRMDPVSVKRILPGDRQRLIRAIEIAWNTKTPFSEHLSRWGSRTDRYSNLKVGLTMSRESLYRVLNQRVRQFFSSGLIQELEGILRTGCPREANSLKAIGYREALRFLRDRISLDEAILQAQKSTRRYAKRQWTWFSKLDGIRWFPVDDGLDSAWQEMIPYLDERLNTG